MTTSKIWKDIASHQVFDTENVFENNLGIWSSNTVHSIETYAEVRSLNKFLDCIKVKKTAHVINVFSRVVNDLYKMVPFKSFDWWQTVSTNEIGWDVVIIFKQIILPDFLGLFEDLVGNVFGGWSTV